MGYALQPFIDNAAVPATYPVIAADDITQRTPAKWIVRTGWATSQPMHPFTDWVLKNTKYKKVTTMGMDYAFGYETVGGFQRVFEEGGGQIVQKIWTPLNTNDFAPFLSQIKRDSDAVLALFVGRLALQFMKQYQEAGLHGKIPLLGGGTTTDESVLPQMGDEALGTITALHYSQAIETPANKKFAQAFEAKAGKIASYYSEATYTNMRWIVEAIKAAGGKVEDQPALLVALRGREAPEHGHRHLPGRQPVLEIQGRGLSQAAALRARISAVQALPVNARQRGVTGVPGHPERCGGLGAVSGPRI